MSDTNSIVIASEPVVAPEGHDAKMIALVDSANGEGDLLESKTTSELPEGITSQEDLLKAYEELLAKSKGETTPEPEVPEAKTEDAPKDKAEEALKGKGLDLAEFSAEFGKNGSLSQESYEKLAAAGFDKNLVDSYVAGQQALASQYDNAVLTEAGGQEKYAEIVGWAKANLTDSEINAYNSAVSSGNLEQAKLAVAGLNAKFSKSVGSEPVLQQGRKVSASEDVFESTAQMTAAMRDPRYRNDPAYRAKVQSKLARSNIL